MSKEATNMFQSLQNCKIKLDLDLECLGNLVKDAIQENEDEKKEELLTFINNSTQKLQTFAEMLVEEPKINPLKKRSFETSQPVPDKKLKLSPSPLMDLPNEIWMKILSFLPTYDILKNFNLTCKHFHSLAINPCSIKSLQLKLENAKDSSQYQEIVNVLKRSKTLSKLSIYGSGRMNLILAHSLKSNLLKTLDISSTNATLSKKNLDYLKNSSIEVLKLDDIFLDDDAMKHVGTLKSLKSFRISNHMSRDRMNISELIKAFMDSKIGLEDFAIDSARSTIDINASTLGEFLKESTETLKKLKVHCNVVDQDGKGEMMKWNASSSLEELYYDYGIVGRRNFMEIDFGLDMPKLTKLALCNLNGDMLSMLETQNFPVLKRLYLQKRLGYLSGPGVSRQTIFKILGNCPNLKSIKLVGLDLSDPNPVDTWYNFLSEMHKTFNVYIDVFGYHIRGSCTLELEDFEKFLKKTDLAIYNKFTKMKASYFDWKIEQFENYW